MNAKKLVVGLVTAVTLSLFGGAAYAQQLAAPRRTTQPSPLPPLTEKSATERTSNTGRRRCK